jgi:hypothetical protein
LEAYPAVASNPLTRRPQIRNLCMYSSFMRGDAGVEEDRVGLLGRQP